MEGFLATRMSHFDWQGPDLRGPGLAVAAAAAAAIATMAWVAWRMSPVLILPAASLVLLIAGFGLALACWHRTAREGRLGYRDVAGALVFVGFAAAILTNGDGLAALLDASR